MLLALGIIIFIIGCCVSSYEDASYNAERRAEHFVKKIQNTSMK